MSTSSRFLGVGVALGLAAGLLVGVGLTGPGRAAAAGPSAAPSVPSSGVAIGAPGGLPPVTPPGPFAVLVRHSDAIPKLRGLARYAERYDGEVHRIEAVSKIGDTLRVLDMTSAAVRLPVSQAEDAKALYLSHGANYY